MITYEIFETVDGDVMVSVYEDANDEFKFTSKVITYVWGLLTVVARRFRNI